MSARRDAVHMAVMTDQNRPVSQTATIEALSTLIERMERQEAALSERIRDLRDAPKPQPGSLAEMDRLGVKREGLRIGLTDAREELALAVERERDYQATYEAMVEGDTAPLAVYSAALDEVFALRQAVAYEAEVIGAHLSYATFPKSRRAVAETQIERLRESARGRAQVAYAGTSYLSLKHALREAGAATTLTRHAFEASLPTRSNR